MEHQIVRTEPECREGIRFLGLKDPSSVTVRERGVYGQEKGERHSRQSVGGNIGMSQFSHAVFKPPSTTPLQRERVGMTLNNLLNDKNQPKELTQDP